MAIKLFTETEYDTCADRRVIQLYVIRVMLMYSVSEVYLLPSSLHLKKHDNNQFIVGFLI